MSDIFLVRQPVFGPTGNRLGYEIRVRDSEDGRDAFARSVLSGTFDLVRGDQPAFVTWTREQLLDPDFPTVDPKIAVLFLPPSLAADPEIVAALERYRAEGGSVALDDLDEAQVPSEALLPYATWARVDMRLGDLALIGRICDRMTAGNKSVRLMACCIEAQEEFEFALNMVMDGFQGTYFSTPEPVAAAELPQSTVTALRLLGSSRDPKVTDPQLEAIIATDPVITFHLLRLVNSASAGGRGVQSIGQALRLVGRTALQRWLAVAVAVSRKSKTGVDQELVQRALERGHLLEQLTGDGRESGTLFLIGLFSMLDAVFRMPLPQLLERAALSKDVTDALLEHTGPYAPALAFVEAYEAGDFEQAFLMADRLQIARSRITEVYMNALKAAHTTLGTVSA